MWQAMYAASRAEVNSTAMEEVGRLLGEQSLDKVLGGLRDVLPGLACEGGLLCQDGLPVPRCVRVDKTRGFPMSELLLSCRLNIDQADIHSAEAVQIAMISLANQAHVALSTYCLLNAALHVTNAQVLHSCPKTCSLTAVLCDACSP